MPSYRRVIRTIWGVLFFLGCIASFPPPVSAAALSLDEGMSKARELAKDGDAAGVYSLYMELLREYPDDFSVNLGLARAAKSVGKFNHSRMAYERLIATLPDNAQIRLEFAHLLLAMGQREEARIELAEAKRLDPSVSEGDIGKRIKGMERQVSTLLTKARIAGGILYDSNMTTGPALRGVQVGGIPIVLDRASGERESMGSYLHAVGDIAWRANADTPWWVVADVTGYQRWYERTTPRRDLTFGRAALGVRYLQGNLLSEVRLKTDMVLENEERSVNLYGSEGLFLYALRNDLHLFVRAGLDHREDVGTRGRSGTYAWGGPYARWFFGKNQHSVIAGLKGYTSATNERRYGFSGVEPSLTVLFNLPWRTELILSGSWHNEDYKGGATVLDGQNRRDTQWRGSVFAVKKITDWLQVEAGWQYTDNTSNSDLYTYDQHVVTLGLALNF